ncbi:lipopolysaccharide biosynthesis protein [Vibrio sp. M260121]|uniref:lipopolysaccharide biosynthesis protein n=1 Tax=Vibrio sp. M260121 TaxID=3020897 RepID=UPI002F3F2C75
MKIISSAAVRKAIRPLAMLFFSSIGTGLISILSLYIMVRALGVETYGALMLAFSYIMVIGAIINLQSVDALIKFIPYEKSPELKTTLINKLLLVDVITAVFGFLVCYASIQFVSEALSWGSLISELLYSISFYILFNVSGTFDGIYRYYGYFKWISFRNFLVASILCALYYIASCKNYGVHYYALIISISSLLVLVFDIFYFLLKRKEIDYRGFRFERVDVRVLKYTLISNLNSNIDLPIKKLSPILIANLMSLQDVGIYKILEKLGAVVLKVISVFLQFFGADISRLIASGNITKVLVLGRKFTILFIIGSSIILSIFYVSFESIVLYFSPEIATYKNEVFTYLFYVIIISSMFYQHTVAIYSGHEFKVLKLIFIVNFLYLCLMNYFVSTWGLIGLIILQIIQATIIFLGKNKFISDGLRGSIK